MLFLCVDRTEAETVILTDDREQVYTMPVASYVEMTGRSPEESAILRADLENGRIVTLIYDGEETRERMRLARERLHRLFGKDRS